MSELIEKPITSNLDWKQEPGFWWCHDNGGVTIRQYRISDESMVYRHYDTIAEFCERFKISVKGP